MCSFFAKNRELSGKYESRRMASQAEDEFDWKEIVLLASKVKAGRITEEVFNRRVNECPQK